MNIPFIDFSQQYQTVKDKVDTGLKDVFERGAFILGQEEKNFEEAFAKYCGAKYAVGVNSGTDALYLALKSLHVGPGDEVIVPAMTFIATALAVSYTGATPVFADAEEHTFNLDPQSVKAKITSKTKAIMPVHLYGQTATMDQILAIAKEKGIFVVEDSCQGHGALYKGKRAGSLGDAGCFSFYPTKGLGAFGDGGIIVTSNKELADQAKMLRDYGRTDRYAHKFIGYNSRLDTVQAVVLNAKLPYLDEWNQMRIDHAAYYGKLLKGIKGVVIPTVAADRNHVYQTYAVRLTHRDKVLEGLKEKGVGVLIHYPIPVHLQEAYANLKYKKGDFPVTERLADEVLSLPMFPHMTNAQIEYVCESLKNCM
ncbi:MAG: DegT/DnrJ/EryC1/StrS family aminotransferase [Candidatus Omnitrophica bacterium]|nr:DegT/DnrJ/EryC1/StrS family aminotransferase [Candidatus Omnitrophota bacterium]